MNKLPEQWFEQADYDMGTAEAVFISGRYIHSIFMCHLSIEKSLKGLFAQKFNTTPPRTHSLIFLLEKLGLEASDDIYDLIFTLNRISVPTRYPDNLQRMLKDYDKEKTENIINKSKEVLKWLKLKL